MSYTAADARAFERLLEVLRGAKPYRMTEHLRALDTCRALREIGVAPDIQVLAALMRTERWKAWLRDYEQVRGATVIREALTLLPVEVAKVMALEYARGVRTGGDLPRVEHDAAARVMSAPVEHNLGELLGAALPEREALTGSLRVDNASPTTSVEMPAPPPPPQQETTDDPSEWSEVRPGGHDDTR